MNLIDELIEIRNYIGQTIDDETLFICEHELIEWIDEILAKVAEE